jgi:asparagine synthase (glutamine-hydrolysing)
MCGICGELRLDGGLPDLAAVGRMAAAVVRRGPDHQGVFAEGPVAFGHRRLAVIDLSRRSNQPLVDSELGLVLVFNGTIYNFRELRAELEGAGYRFFSEGDTEVILKAYAAWGDRCAERLHGMFAFALWDVRRQRVLLARDRLGIKPLYYCRNAHRLRFASNVQALLAGGDVDTALDAVALHHHLTLHAVVPPPRTVLSGVRKVAPAHTVGVDAAGLTEETRYWELRAQRPQSPVTEQEWLVRLHAALQEAVKRRLSVADVPVGVLLSGGLDSSLLVALLAEAGVSDLRTFSIGFEDAPEERGSEFEYSDQVVQRYSTRHQRYRVPNREVLDRLAEAVACMAEPMVGQDAIAFYLLAERVSRDVKVVQSGQGADEVFGGYFWYPLMDRDVGTDIDRFRRHYFDRSHEEFQETVTPPFHGADHTTALVRSLLSDAPADTFLDRVLHTDVTTLIVDDPVKRVDNMTMAFGLEARVPYLDHELVELAMQMPPELKLRDSGKYPLKALARGRLPDAVIDRKKGYFPVPALKYVRGPFLELMSQVLRSDACRVRGLFRRSYVERLLAAPEHFVTPLQGSKVWHLALLELWLQVNVDRTPMATRH